jgi:serine/threonine protein kinase
LKFLHKNKVIHGDLKPENVLIDKEGYFSVADFSSARFYGCDNKEIKGTKGYMAP